MSVTLRRYPEIRARLETALIDALDGLDTNDIAVMTLLLDAIALEDADQHSLLRKILALRGLENLRGDDIDRWALIAGTLLKKSLARKPATASYVRLIVSNSVLPNTRTVLAADVLAGALTFTVQAGTGGAFPASGQVELDVGTSTSERVVFVRVGDIFTVIQPPAAAPGLAVQHKFAATVWLKSQMSYMRVAHVATTTIVLMSTGTGSGWPTVGSVIVARGTVNESKYAFTRTGDTLTINNPGLLVNFSAGTTLHVVTSGINKPITVSSSVYVAATATSVEINYRTTDAATLFDGDYYSDLVTARSEQVGVDTNVATAVINKWRTPPFSGATVTNPTGAYGGANREDDDPYKERIAETIQARTTSTPLGVVNGITGITDPDTGKTVVYASLVEPIVPGMGVLYITDGTSGFTAETAVYSGRDVLINNAVTGDKRARLSRTAPYAVQTLPMTQRTPRLFKSVFSGVSTSVGVGYLEDLSKVLTPAAYVGKVLLTSDGQFYNIIANTSVRLTVSGAVVPASGNYSVFDFTVNPLEPGVDYTFNRSSGDLELVTALSAHDALVAASDGALPNVGAYTYSTGLVAYAQKVLNGDPNDIQNFPGLLAHGQQTMVDVPVIVSTTFVFKVTPIATSSLSQVDPLVRQRVLAYVNSRDTGRKGVVYLSELVRLCKSLSTVQDFIVVSPTSNPTPAANQLIRVSDSDISIG